MNTCITASLSEKLLYRLLVIKCAVRKHILHKKQHKQALTTAIGKVIYSILAVEAHHEIVVHLCTEIIFNIINSDSVNLWHRVLHS